jgi:hypothetical protein
MGEMEMRVAALETLFLAIAPWVDPATLDDAEADLRAGLAANVAGDERVIRLQALQHIEDARKRFQPALLGWATTCPYSQPPGSKNSV